MGILNHPTDQRLFLISVTLLLLIIYSTSKLFTKKKRFWFKKLNRRRYFIGINMFSRFTFEVFEDFFSSRKSDTRSFFTCLIQRIEFLFVVEETLDIKLRIQFNYHSLMSSSFNIAMVVQNKNKNTFRQNQCYMYNVHMKRLSLNSSTEILFSSQRVVVAWQSNFNVLLFFLFCCKKVINTILEVFCFLKRLHLRSIQNSDNDCLAVD